MREILDQIAQAIYDKKGFNILALDIHEVSSLTNYFVIAEGNVDRHVKAISEEIKDRLKEHGFEPIHIEGGMDSDWIVMDYGDVIIHLFIPDMRERYRLEELWHEGKVVDLKIDVTQRG